GSSLVRECLLSFYLMPAPGKEKARHRWQAAPGKGLNLSMEDLSQSDCVVNEVRPAESSVEALRCAGGNNVSYNADRRSMLSAAKADCATGWPGGRRKKKHFLRIPMQANNSFDKWQADYAAHGVATFPVDADKRPMVSRYSKFGLVGSAEIASKFANAPAIGFMCGKRNGITSLDCDSRDERVLADALSRHGQTPLVARTGSGHFQAWYRHNGERRRIRPDRNVPIDILGAGFVV